jgi:SAM-dependent methyltransferase
MTSNLSPSLSTDTLTRAYFQTRFKPEPVRDYVWQCITNYLWPVLSAGFSKGLSDSAHVLELGAGYASWIKSLPVKNRHALDLNPDLRSVLDQQELRDIKSYVQSATDLKVFEDQSLDLVLASNLLEHLILDDAVKCAQEVFRVLKPGGRFCVIQPNFKLCPREYFDDYTHRTIFTDVSLTDLLETVGFETEKIWKRFVPFSMKGQSGKLSFLLPFYLRSPLKPLAGQMCLILKKPLKGQN